MEYLVTLIVGLVVGFMIGKIAGYTDVLVTLKLHECDVKIAKARNEREKIERRISRLERKQLRFKKEDVAP